MMDPNDSKYNLTTHFGMQIKDSYNNPIYPNLRSLHLVESRDTEPGKHLHFTMHGGINQFENLPRLDLMQ